MFSTFMAHVRSRRQDETNPETSSFGGALNHGYSAESASTPHRPRRAAASSGDAIVSGSVASERSTKLGSRGHGRGSSTSTSTPTSTSTVTITNPIRRETPGSFEYSGSGRRDRIGVAPNTEWRERDEMMKPRSNSRRRRLYPPSQDQETAMSSSPNLSNDTENVPDFTMVPFERPQSRAEHRPGDRLAFGPLPEVVRLDSRGTGESDNGTEIEIQSAGYDPRFQHTHSYPYAIPNRSIDSNPYLPSFHPSRDTPSARGRSKSPRPPRPPKSQKRHMHPYSQRSAQASQSTPSLDGSRPTARSASAVSQEHLALPTDQTRSETQSHSEADFYASAVEDLEAETDGSSDYNSDNNGSAFASVLDSFPLPTRSVTSTTSSSRSESGPSSPASAGPSAVGGQSMTKHRWGLRLQVQQLQGTRGGNVGGPTGIGYTTPPHAAKGNAPGAGASSSSLNLVGQQPSGSMPVPIDFPVASSSSLAASRDIDASDVYKHPPGYNYAFTHPLSPIAEQDYMSPSPHSSKDENRSLRFRAGSGSVREKGHVLSSSVERGGNKEETHADGDDRVSIRASVRTGSLGSATGIVMSRTGSGDGTGIHNKLGSAPDIHRPFITRQLNRTVSQTSSKSWTESVVGQPTPTPTATPTHSSAQPSPRIDGIVPSHIQGVARTITTHLPAIRAGSNNRNGTADTPNSTGATSNSVSGTMYSPTSTLQQSLSNGSSAIQPPPGAIVATTQAVPTSHGSSSPTGGEGRAGTILKLPSIPAFDLRFSMLESVTPRNSRRVDKMPIIPGSTEGHREYEEDEDEYERHSLHPDSFVTAGDVEGGGVELDSMNDAGEELFIHRRWERDAGLGSGAPISSEDCPTFRAKSEWTTFTPAFWTFWMGLLFPVLWLIGGWHFTNIGEMPPKYTIWEWFFWKRRWRPRRWFKALRGLLACCRPRPRRRLRRANSSASNANARAGKVYPALPRWVAEKQSTDDGRMRLNDPKRSLKGIQFGYPFIPRYETGHYTPPSFGRIFTAPNRILDQLYGVRLREVRGRPETGRRMLDPWIQRCRYAFCYALLLLAIGLCTASIYLIMVNTRNLRH